MSVSEYVYEREKRERRNAIIEECARVVENYEAPRQGVATLAGIAAAIRAKKDKP